MASAGVLSIGTELTRGELVNSNAAWLGGELTAIGYDVVEHAVVGDDAEHISETVLRLAHRLSVVIVTGGLGPTTDDLTAEAAAKAAGVALVRDPETLRRIQRRWDQRGQDMPLSNRKQADLPEGAEIFPNPVGTAPAFGVKVLGCRFYFLPGVPKEMRVLFRDAIAPKVASGVEQSSHQIHMRTFGLSESQIADLLDGVEGSFPGVTLGYRAHFPEIEIKVLGRGEGPESSRSLARRASEVVRQRLGDIVYGDADDSFPGAVGDQLRSRRKTLALAESCTGGMIGAMLTRVPGSSDYLLLDAVVYSNAAKMKVLAVQEELLRAHGAVSLETAEAMAQGALRVGASDIAVSVTGIAGPAGGTEAKPVGTVCFGLAVAGAPGASQERRFYGDRERIRTLAAYHALRIVSCAAAGRPIGDI